MSGIFLPQSNSSPPPHFLIVSLKPATTLHKGKVQYIIYHCYLLENFLMTFLGCGTNSLDFQYFKSGNSF